MWLLSFFSDAFSILPPGTNALVGNCKISQESFIMFSLSQTVTVFCSVRSLEGVRFQFAVNNLYSCNFYVQYYEGHSDRNRTSAVALLWDEIIQSFKRQNSSTSDVGVDEAT